MPYGDPFTQLRVMEGIASEVALNSSRYTSNLEDTSTKAAARNTVNALTTDTSERPKAKPIVVDYSGTQAAFTLGRDPMVSSASVIHELAYGRINADQENKAKVAVYRMPQKSIPLSLDIIV